MGMLEGVYELFQRGRIRGSILWFGMEVEDEQSAREKRIPEGIGLDLNRRYQG